MISQPLPSFKTQFYREEEVGSYDNIALNMQFIHGAPPMIKVYN